MADQTPEMTPEIRAFAEKARAEGWSDEDIIGFMRSKTATTEQPSAAIRKGDVRAAQMEGLKEGIVGGAKGFAEGVMGAPRKAFNGILKLAQHPLQTMEEGLQHGDETVKNGPAPSSLPTAGAHPEEWGKSVGDTTGQILMGEAASAGVPKIPAGARMLNNGVAKAAQVVADNPGVSSIVGAGLGYAHGGPMGALEGAVIGPGVGRLGRGILKVAKTAKEGEAAAAVAGDIFSPEEVAALKKQGFTDETIEKAREVERKRANAPAETASRTQAGKQPTPARTRFERVMNNTMADERGLPSPATTRPMGRPMPASGMADDPSFVRSVPAEYAVPMRDAEIVQPPPSDVVEGEILGEKTRPGLPKPAIATAPPDDPSFVRAVRGEFAASKPPSSPPNNAPKGLPQPAVVTPPPEDTSGITGISRAQKVIGRDPKTGRARRTFTGEPSTGVTQYAGSEATTTPKAEAPAVAAPKAFEQSVRDLANEGHGAEQIARQLRDHPDLVDKSPQERINLVRSARGTPAGDLPARAQKAIDETLGKLKTNAEKKAYLMRAPNAAAYNYIKSKIGL